MSSARFAPITSSLLARKGDASPSLATLPIRPSAFGDARPPFPAPPPVFAPECGEPAKPQAPAPSASVHDNHAERPRRIVVSLTADEFEKLGIAAIKKDRSRHEIVRGALDAYFHQLATELPRACNCMAKGSCCS